MNRHVVAALFQDALYQVLDNKVFRILVGLVLALVLSTFLVGAREDALVLLFGWKEIFYEDLFAFFHLPYPGLEGANEILIQTIQSIIVDGLAGTLGITLAIAATAFFVPRMLEKGAADTLFSKPVGRLPLLLSRYLAGLIFVALLAVVLIGGMHVGFELNSGYSDPGFLWTIATLTYLFGLLHGVSLLVGVVTRSTVAAILLTLMFMMLNGCVHMSWRGKEMFLVQRPDLREEQELAEAGDGEHEQPPDEGQESEERWLRALFFALDALHYTLPKTSDATPIARLLRENLETRYAELWDPPGGLLIRAPPEGWERKSPDAELTAAGLVWEPPDGSATIRLTARPSKGTSRLRAAKALRLSLENRPQVSELEDENQEFANTASTRLDWVETVDDLARVHRAQVFARGERLYTLEIESDHDFSEDDASRGVLRRFLRGFTFNESEQATDPGSWFEARLGWSAPLPFNAWFSIGSSLVFLGAALGLAWWRLARVDF